MSKAKTSMASLKEESLTLKEMISQCLNSHGGRIFKVEYTTVPQGLLEAVTMRFSDNTAMRINKFINASKEEASLTITLV